MQLPQPHTSTHQVLITDIEKGQIKIPQFQRDFVWKLEDSARLIDSIVKGYPIGTFIFWRTREQLRSVRNLGNIALPESKDEAVDYVLDGQQRLTSLFACLKGAKIQREHKVDNFAEIYIDLEANEHEDIVVSQLDEKKEKAQHYISIINLLEGGFKTLASYPEKYHEKMQTYADRIKSYQYSIIQIKDAPLDIATDIFTRINVGGKSLTLFEIMVAKTYDETQQFDLAEKYDTFNQKLINKGYGEISDATVLQVLSMILRQECSRQTILSIPKTEFIQIWDKAIDAMEATIDFFRNSYHIPVAKLLPYNALIVPFAYYFHRVGKNPTGKQAKFLQDFFWRCALSERYSAAVESKLAQDVKRIEKILKENKQPEYDWTVDISPEFIMDNGWFSVGRSYIKAILCLYASKTPLSFNNNNKVVIDNSWLKQTNSKNYHHFFPKAYLEKKKYDAWEINHILNITIVDDFLNKQEIRTKAPSKYMAEFAKENELLATTMKSHLISNLDKFGIWDDNYEEFLKQRAKAVSKELDKRILKIHKEK